MTLEAKQPRLHPSQFPFVDRVHDPYTEELVEEEENKKVMIATGGLRIAPIKVRNRQRKELMWSNHEV